jgi:hypothetical protein
MPDGNPWNDFEDGGVNPVEVAKLQLNGHDRFAERDGTYFNLVQPFQHHENVPSDKGINVYSFALRPEEHQPTGTLNMSRIDTAVLSLTTTSGSNGGKVKVFAVNYNVLRIMSGMGGLALPLWCAIYCTLGIGRKSYLPKQFGFLFWKNQLCSQLHACKEPIASGKLHCNQLQDTLLFGNPLRAWSTNGLFERMTWLRVMNSGMVKMIKIGQPACLSSKSAKVGYDEASETERVSVDNDGLAIQSLLKIQSIPLGKLRGNEIPTKQCHSMCMTTKPCKNITVCSFLFKIPARILFLNLVSLKMTYIYLRIKHN